MMYLRQQYAFCPRWWYLFRFVINRIQLSKNPSGYLNVLRLLLAGHRKERKLLASYLHIQYDEPKDTSFDKCFDKSKHNAYLHLLLNVCDEFLSLGVAQFESTRLIQHSSSPTIEKEDEALYQRVKASKERNLELLDAFMKVFTQAQRERVARVLDYYSDLYRTYGYVDYLEVFETIYSTIFNVPTAVEAFRKIMDSGSWFVFHSKHVSTKPKLHNVRYEFHHNSIINCNNSTDILNSQSSEQMEEIGTLSPYSANTRTNSQYFSNLHKKPQYKWYEERNEKHSVWSACRF